MMNQQCEMHMDEFGAKRWTLNGKLHREDGPAYISKDGTKAWHQHGKLHRIDGAAIEGANGNKSWYVNGTWYDDITAWAVAALAYENKPSTPDAVDAKIMQVMQADLFN